MPLSSLVDRFFPRWVSRQKYDLLQSQYAEAVQAIADYSSKAQAYEKLVAELSLAVTSSILETESARKVMHQALSNFSEHGLQIISMERGLSPKARTELRNLFADMHMRFSRAEDLPPETR